MGLKDRLLRAKCSAGFHSGEWKQIAAGTCDEQRTCANCGEVSNRTDHHLSDWAYSADPAAPACTRERSCQRCPLVDRDVKHTMEWQYVHTASEKGLQAAMAVLSGRREQCRQANVCSRCGQTDGKTRIMHRWDNGHDYQEDAYRPLQTLYICLHCGLEDIRGHLQPPRY
jgi:hypothetical protein